MKKLLLISVLLSCAVASAQQLHFTVAATELTHSGDVMAGNKVGDSTVNAIVRHHSKNYIALASSNNVTYIVCCGKLTAGETLTGDVRDNKIEAVRDSDNKKMTFKVVSSKISGQ